MGILGWSVIAFLVGIVLTLLAVYEVLKSMRDHAKDKFLRSLKEIESIPPADIHERHLLRSSYIVHQAAFIALNQLFLKDDEKDTDKALDDLILFSSENHSQDTQIYGNYCFVMGQHNPSIVYDFETIHHTYIEYVKNYAAQQEKEPNTKKAAAPPTVQKKTRRKNHLALVIDKPDNA